MELVEIRTESAISAMAAAGLGVPQTSVGGGGAGSQAAVPVLLSEGSAEWGMVEYYLQLATRTTMVKLRKCWSLHIPSAERAFEQRSAGSSLVLPCWLPVSQLDQGMNGSCATGDST